MVELSMRDWWRRFIALPDRQRAVLLIKILGIALIILLYVLGGAGLYLRRHYLDVTPTATPAATAVPSAATAVPSAATAAAPTIEGVVTLTPTPQVTLYPTRTPHGGAGG
jgi:hypothetical protein